MHGDTLLREHARQTGALIAQHLGDGWTVDTTGNYADGRVRLVNGYLRLLLQFGGRLASERDKVKITGLLPDHTLHHVPWALRNTKREISVGRDRGPSVIAREITKRLMPSYVTVVDETLDAHAQSQRDGEARRATVDRLAVAFKGDARHENQVLFSSGHYGELSVNHDGTECSSLTLRGITIEQAEQIAAVLR